MGTANAGSSKQGKEKADLLREGSPSVEGCSALFRGAGIVDAPAAGPGNESDDLVEAPHVELRDDWC